MNDIMKGDLCLYRENYVIVISTGIATIYGETSEYRRCVVLLPNCKLQTVIMYLLKKINKPA